jgi:hypothetical protein
VDGTDVRGQARRIEECATEVREQAGVLVAAGTVRWRSVAADRFRAGLEQRRGELVRAAEALDAAARALRRHADALDGGVARWWP